MRRKRKSPQLYLICADDHLETAFFCGTSAECTRVLHLNNTGVFYSMLSKKQRVWGFFRIEKVRITEP